MANGILGMPPGILNQQQGTQLMQAGNDAARDQALTMGLARAGAGLLMAPNLREGLGQGLLGFQEGFNRELIANRPKVTPLAGGAFSQISFPDGRVEVMSNDQVQQFMREQESMKEARYKPPTGYMWNPTGDQLVAIPGGPAAAKAEAEESRIKNALIPKAESRGSIMADQLATAYNQVDWTSSGFVGQLAKVFGGTDATDLGSTIDTIIALIGFDELQAMREASTTGGALGQVAVKELEMLQAVLGSLKQEQSPPQLKKNIKKVYERYASAYEAIRKMYEAEGKTMAPLPKVNFTDEQATISSPSSSSSPSLSDNAKQFLQ